MTQQRLSNVVTPIRPVFAAIFLTASFWIAAACAPLATPEPPIAARPSM